MKVVQSCPTICDLLDHTVHGILQARILEWVAVPFSRASSWPRDWTPVSWIGRWILYHRVISRNLVDAKDDCRWGRTEEISTFSYALFRMSNWIPEKAMATHSSTLAWQIPWTEEPGGLQSTGSLGVGHDWTTSLSLFTFMYWRRKWQLTPVFLPRESQGRGSPVGCHLWGRTESDTTEVT